MRRSDSGLSGTEETSAARRLAKLASFIRSEVGRLLERELELPANTLLTITEVKVVADLSQARVGVSVLPEDKQKIALKILLSKTPELQHLINQKLRLYRVPKLFFYLDPSLVKADHIDSLLDSIKEE